MPETHSGKNPRPDPNLRLHDLSYTSGDPFASILSPATPSGGRRVASAAPQGGGSHLPPAYQVAVGTRVSLDPSRNVRLCYAVQPPEGVLGTVVRVRHGNMDSHHEGGYLFVRWDDGKLVPVLSAHLRKALPDRRASASVRVAAGSLDSVLQSSRFARSGDDLIHTSTKDLWSVHAAEDGTVVVERLFDLDGNPLKA